MRKSIKLGLALFALGVFSISDAYEIAYSLKDAQKIINDNFEPKDCGKVTSVFNRKGGGQSAVCSNGEIYMLAQLKGKPVAMRCSILDKYKAKGVDLGLTTAQCEGK